GAEGANPPSTPTRGNSQAKGQRGGTSAGDASRPERFPLPSPALRKSTVATESSRMSAPLQRTPLYDAHIAAGARTVDFGGWDMPVNYGSQIEEHHAVRQASGMFDVSHMLNVDVTG